MRVEIRVVPKASRISVKEEQGHLKVCLTQPACDNRANKQLVETVAAHFKVKKYDVRIVSGEKSKNKLIEIIEGK